MCEIRCILTKGGNDCYVLVINDVYVSFDRRVIERVAKSVGVSIRELYALEIGDTIKI